MQIRKRRLAALTAALAVMSSFCSALPQTAAAADAVTVYIGDCDGNGFKLGGDYTNNVVRVVNCLAVGNTVKGFDQNNNDGTMEIYNCSAYSNGSDFNFSRADYGTVIVKNCLTLGEGKLRGDYHGTEKCKS